MRSLVKGIGFLGLMLTFYQAMAGDMEPVDLGLAGFMSVLLISLGESNTKAASEAVESKPSFFGLVISIILSLLVFLGASKAFSEKPAEHEHAGDIIAGLPLKL